MMEHTLGAINCLSDSSDLRDMLDELPVRCECCMDGVW